MDHDYNAFFNVNCTKYDYYLDASEESLGSNENSTLQALQRDSRVSYMIPFPLDLKIDENIVTIDERSNNYVVVNKITCVQVINPYAK